MFVQCCYKIPTGEWIAIISQDSYIRFLKFDELEKDDAPTRAHNIMGLPLLSLCFISDTFFILNISLLFKVLHK